MSLWNWAGPADGIEMIQHMDAPIYGFQFHPEMFVDQTVGDDIYSEICYKRLKKAIELWRLEPYNRTMLLNRHIATWSGFIPSASSFED